MAPGVNGPTLNVKQFQVLTKLLEQGVHFSQREMAELLRYSLGTINKTVRELTEQKLIVDGHVSSLGLEALEPYRVKRAVFLAAGFGPRLVPVTLNTPKPLVRIKGVRMIDTLLDAAAAAEIEEIYIVRGYLGEQFDQLLYKYPNIRFIENPRYNEENNISSAICARHLFQNAYVLEADFMLYNPSLIQKYQYASNYLGVPVETSDDWCFETKNHVISKLKIGGTNCYHVVRHFLLECRRRPNGWPRTSKRSTRCRAARNAIGIRSHWSSAGKITRWRFGPAPLMILQRSTALPI